MCMCVPVFVCVLLLVLAVRGVDVDVGKGTKLGPWLFLIMINDLDINNASLWKFVDDTTTSEVVNKGQPSRAQAIADEVSQWSTTNRVQLNSDKCKELRISFFRNQREFRPVMVDNN